MGKKNKYYVVWNGKEPGIYESWEICKKQIEGFAGAKYKSFNTKAEAEYAFNMPAQQYFDKTIPVTSFQHLPQSEQPIADSFCVDAAWHHINKKMEYRGVDTITGAEIFKQGPFEDATVNIGEFLAIVHALAFCKQRNIDFTIYSDSVTAISWVKHKNPRTKLIETPNNKKVFELIQRAVAWLHQNSYANPILKWQTEKWGENPADFGRK